MDSMTHDVRVVSVPILEGYRDLLDVNDLVKLFQVSKQTIYREIKNGKFGTPICIGRAIKIPKIYLARRYFSGS